MEMVVIGGAVVFAARFAARGWHRFIPLHVHKMYSRAVTDQCFVAGLGGGTVGFASSVFAFAHKDRVEPLFACNYHPQMGL